MNPGIKDVLAGVPEVLRPLLPELCGDLRSLAEEAVRQSGQGDMKAAAATAHALKGACMRFSLEALTRAASEAEEAARRGSGQETVRSLERFTVLLAELSQFLGEAPA